MAFDYARRAKLGIPAITNALGCLVADLRHDFVQTINRPLGSVDIEQISAIFELHTKKGKELIEKEPVFIKEISVAYSLDMQFIGQTHVLNVPLQNPEVSIEIIQAAFNDVYFNRFKYENFTDRERNYYRDGSKIRNKFRWFN